MARFPLKSAAAKKRWEAPTQKMLEHHKRYRELSQTPEAREKRRLKAIGRPCKPVTQETRDKISASNRGKATGDKNAMWGVSPWNAGDSLGVLHWQRIYESKGNAVWYGAVRYIDDRTYEQKKLDKREEVVGGFWYGSVRYPQQGVFAVPRRGALNHLWKGGISTLNHAIRDCRKGLEWRDAVFARDGYRCRITGKRGKNLRAHHIIQLKDLIEQFGIKTLEEAYEIAAFWDINNGVTMKHETHLLYHKLHGRGNGR